MNMQRIDIDNIIAFLLTQTSITSLVGTRIYWAFPKTEQAWNYIVLWEITENIDVVEWVARLEFRFISKDDNGTWRELRLIERALTTLIAQKWKVDFNWFIANDVKLEANIFRGYDDKERKTYIRDFTFYFFS